MSDRIGECQVSPEIKRVARAISVDRGFAPDKLDVHGVPAWVEWTEVAKVAHDALLTSNDGTKMLTISRDDAQRICARLEFDASWDKVGSGYYLLKRQIQGA